MELDKTQPPNVPKIIVTPNDKCHICGIKLLDDKNEKPTKAIMKPETLPGIVHQACWLPYIAEKDIRILYKLECYSIGDTIAGTPLLRHLKSLYPNAQIHVITLFPDLFKYNPHIGMIIDLNKDVPLEMLSIYMFNINGFDTKQGSHFSEHSVSFSARGGMAKDLLPGSMQYEVNYAQEDCDEAIEILKANGIDPENDKLILIQPHGTEWKTRDWGPHKFPELALRLQEKYPDYKLVSIGGKRAEVANRVMSNYVEIPGAVDLYSKLSLLQSIALMQMKCSKIIITPDTGTLHMAATAPELPIVGVFTVIKAHFRTPERNGVLGYKFIGINADDPCNCSHLSRPLTNQGQFDVCPKRTFMQKTLANNLPKPFKKTGLELYIPEFQWSENKLGEQIRERLVHFEDPLPCFPSVDKVFLAVQKMMEQHVLPQ